MIQLALAAGVAGLLYWAIAPAEPKSMPIITIPGAKGAFVSSMYNAIINAAPGLNAQAIALMIAQAAYESAWGRTTAYRQGNNAFNITRLVSSGLPVVEGPDTECDADNNCRPITQRFAAYDSLEESVSDFLDFIGHARYIPAKPLLLAGNIDYLDALYRGHYFTQPLPIYKANMLSVLNSVNDQLANA